MLSLLSNNAMTCGGPASHFGIYFGFSLSLEHLHSPGFLAHSERHNPRIFENSCSRGSTAENDLLLLQRANNLAGKSSHYSYGS